jgi:hypothetical protein
MEDAKNAMKGLLESSQSSVNSCIQQKKELDDHLQEVCDRYNDAEG